MKTMVGLMEPPFFALQEFHPNWVPLGHSFTGGVWTPREGLMNSWSAFFRPQECRASSPDLPSRQPRKRRRRRVVRNTHRGSFFFWSVGVQEKATEQQRRRPRKPKPCFGPPDFLESGKDGVGIDNF